MEGGREGGREGSEGGRDGDGKKREGDREGGTDGGFRATFARDSGGFRGIPRDSVITEAQGQFTVLGKNKVFTK